ncbi:MAG TPA: glycosyltransferase, partial [Pirellulaceae bacterium]|nr:glycosyltransferase [Pirellulaceae bacterium]
FYMLQRSALDREAGARLGIKFIDYVPSGRSSLASLATWLGSLSGLQDSTAGAAAENCSNNLPVDGESLEVDDGKTIGTEEVHLRQSLTLQDYRWPLAAKQFLTAVRREKPGVILVEYVVWAHLLEALHQAAIKIPTIVDTHDVLHLRNLQFKQRNQMHWLDITAEEEATELKKADLIIAIQEEEAVAFRQLVPNVEVVVAGHVPYLEKPIFANELGDSSTPFISSQAIPRDANQASCVARDSKIRIGFIGSNNEANVDGIHWFIRECWPAILERASCPVELLIGGPLKAILETRMQLHADSHVRFLNKIDDVVGFYQLIDVVINPVRFGTGLKIKTVEAFCFGKPIVTTSHSATGLSDSAKSVAMVADSVSEFADAVTTLVNEEHLRKERTALASQIGINEFAPERVYSALYEWIQVQLT